jgi:uncharacterized protein
LGLASFFAGKYKLCITTDILNEYAEIIERYFSAIDAEYNLAQILLHQNTVQIIRYYEWSIMENDTDDNKFFDCAVAANADYIVSEDKHFDKLSHVAFPSVSAIKIAEFKRILESI